MTTLRVQVVDRAMAWKTLPVLAAALCVLPVGALGQTRAESTPAAPDPNRAMLTTYCVTCHNARAEDRRPRVGRPGPQRRAG